jgi:phosphate:Na+ symporter
MNESPEIALATLVAGFLGGLGLFLLGMMLMTDGLKLAGGKALQHILGTWTRTRTRALASGMGVTALVQSSSAVTVATIGFANAGLLTLGQAVWVIFGSNVGTTMTGWLVALLGFDIRIEAFSLPAIGIGALVYLFARSTRVKHLGLALAGFGVLFLGIDVLKNAFMGLSATVDLGALARPGLGGLFIMLGLGALLTVLMQSSSASIAMALTAAMSGAVPMEAAAAAVIGANLGTTVKALLVVIGATANAKRVAAAHVIFNGLTALVALMVLPWFLGFITWLWGSTGEAPAPAMLLALFHTGFNLLGVALMVPLAPAMIRRLQRHFTSAEEDAARPRFLDASSAGVPDLGLRALVLEVDRLGDMSHRMAREALAERAPDSDSLAAQQSVMERLVAAIGDFAAQVSRGHLPEKIADGVTVAMRVARYHRDVATLAHDIAALRMLRVRHALPGIAEQRRQWQELAIRALDLARLEPGDPMRDSAADAVALVEAEYARLKQALLREGTSGAIPIPEMERQLRIISMARRLVTQADKARRYGDQLEELIGATAKRLKEEAREE